MELALILFGDEVDSNSLATETTRSTDTVNVVFAVGGKVIVNDKGHLLHVDTTSEQIGGDQDTGGSGSELSHNLVTLSLLHVSVEARHGVLLLGHLIRKLLYAPAGIAEDNSLSDVDGLVQVAEGSEFPLLKIMYDI